VLRLQVIQMAVQHYEQQQAGLLPTSTPFVLELNRRAV
jgi:hypothetical protein